MATSIGQSLGQALGQFAFGGKNRQAEIKGMLDGSKAYENESSAKKSLAEALKIEAEASDIKRRQEMQSPEAILGGVMNQYQIPLQEMDSLKAWQQTGKLGGKYDFAADGMGPALPAPDWASRLPQLSRTLGMTQRGMAIGDKNIENYAKAEASARDMGLQDQVIAGKLSPTLLAQSLGKDVFSAQEFGTLNKIEGGLNENTGAAKTYKGYRDSQTAAQKANAAQSYASAGASNASAARTKQQTELDAKGVIKETADGMVLVDPRTGVARPIATQDGKPVQGRAQEKPMPTKILDMQQDALDTLGQFSAVNADIRKLRGQLDSGQIKLSAAGNLANNARNFVGASNEKSQNFATLQSTVEKIRNTTLLLNKGVQTEGDAQRAI